MIASSFLFSSLRYDSGLPKTKWRYIVILPFLLARTFNSFQHYTTLPSPITTFSFGKKPSERSTKSTPTPPLTTAFASTSIYQQYHTKRGDDSSPTYEKTAWYQENSSSSSSTLQANNKEENNMDALHFSQRQHQEAIKHCILPLSPDSHKGSSGRVGILGGSKRYPGAPYYAGMAALHAEADLAFVFCAEEATIPIKSYSPELMVASVYSAKDFDVTVKKHKHQENTDTKIMDQQEAEYLVSDMVEQVEDSMAKLHVLVIGPGLGRCPLVMEATSRIIRKAISMKLPLVLDADALFLLIQPQYHNLLLHNPDNDISKNHDSNDLSSLVVLTPNKMELKRLTELGDIWENIQQQQSVIVVEKGPKDTIRCPFDQNGEKSAPLICQEIGIYCPEHSGR